MMRKDIIWYEGYYMISKSWAVKSLSRLLRNGRTFFFSKEKIIKTRLWKRWYMEVGLHNGTRKQKTIHRLVAQAFIPNPQNKSQVNHKDGDRCNNNISNLERCTNAENIRHSFAELGRRWSRYWKYGKDNSSSKGVLQYDFAGSLIKERWSISDIKRELSYKDLEICRCCKWKRESYKWYIRKYK